MHREVLHHFLEDKDKILVVAAELQFLLCILQYSEHTM